MKLNFIINDYVLSWNLLFGPAISEASYNFREKLWRTYRKQYGLLQDEQKIMLKDIKNFIPDDDTIYNFVLESSLFEDVKKKTENHRQYLMKIWDENKKQVQSLLKEIVRIPYDSFNFIVVHPNMDQVHFEMDNEEKNIVWGRKNDKKNELATLVQMLYTITTYQIGSSYKNYKEIAQAVIELAIKNELYTKLQGKSNYLMGDPSLTFLKKQIYPYWLMYLGADQEKMTSYMMRDRIAFDIDHYPIEPHLKKLDLKGFIEFCIRNQKHILRFNQLEII